MPPQSRRPDELIFGALVVLLLFLGLIILLSNGRGNANARPSPAASPTQTCDPQTADWWTIRNNKLQQADSTTPGAQCIPNAAIPQVEAELRNRALNTPTPRIPFASPTRVTP